MYTYHDDAAVAHLFGVAAGLDSMIIGEGEILGQVREAWNAAEREAASGPSLSRTFRHAVEVGKRARTETAIGRHAVSVSSAAVALATSRLGSLDDRRVLVLGAGSMGEGMALALAGAGVEEIVVANRTAGEGPRARRPRSVGGPSPSTRSPTRWSRATCCSRPPARRTSSWSAARSKTVMQARDGRALLVVDIGVPRNIDPGAGEVFGVTLLDIDDLRAFGEQSLAQRRQEIGHVREIIAEELDRHRIERTAREVAPIITALRAHVDDVRAARARASARQARRPRPRRARGRRAAHPQHRQQGPARADGAREGRRGLGARRALRRRARRAVRPARRRRSRPLMPRPLRVATRGSELARWQAHRVATLLGADTELVVVSTTGDQRTDVPIHAVGGTGIFVKEVQQAVLDGRADVAVHSAKDLPASDNPDGLVLAAIPERADPRDVLVGSTLDALPAGARIAHRLGAPARAAGGAAPRPHLRRAARQHRHPARSAPPTTTRSWSRPPRWCGSGSTTAPTSCLDPSVMLPQVGQGALAVECRVDDDDTLARVTAIDDRRVHVAVDAERAYLAELGGGCDLPCGALARTRSTATRSTIEALLAAIDGHVVLRATARDTDPVVAGPRGRGRADGRAAAAPCSRTARC